MTPERFKEVRALFAEALGLPPAERSAFLKARCASDLSLLEEVESLLAQPESVGSAIAPKEYLNPKANPSHIERSVGLTEAMEPSEAAGTMIGRYHLLQKIGEGGTGAFR